MTSFKPLTSGAVALSLLLLAGCNTGEVWRTPDEYVGDLFRTAKWKPAKRTPENAVELIGIEHVVTFDEGSARMTGPERQRLSQFLSRSRLANGDSVALLGPLRDQGRHDPVTAARLQFVRGELLVMGISSTVPLEDRPDLAAREGISVVVRRSVVISPDCAQPLPAPGNRPRFVMGCSNEANFGQMIADPLDLVQGREADPADGEASALSIERFRARESTEVEEAEAGTTN